MPSIEMLCVGQKTPTQFNFPFAVETDLTRQSHRTRPRFQDVFDSTAGILYHLGNPGMKVDGGGSFFAYELLSAASREGRMFLEFAPEYRPFVTAMLAGLLRESPEQSVLFTSDWQFGPDNTIHERAMSPDDFWHLHDTHMLLLNAHYPIVA